jgi:hypothetical protein
MANPVRLRGGSSTGPIDRRRDDAPDAQGTRRVGHDTPVDGYVTPDGKFRWSAGWDLWVPTGKGDDSELPGPLEWGPLMPDRPHPRGCWCVECWNAGVRYADYAKAKRLRESNGF